MTAHADVEGSLISHKHGSIRREMNRKLPFERNCSGKAMHTGDHKSMSRVAGSSQMLRALRMGLGNKLQEEVQFHSTQLVEALKAVLEGTQDLFIVDRSGRGKLLLLWDLSEGMEVLQCT